MGDGDITFRGTDGIECEEFIRAVRLRVRSESRTDDNDWIVQFVSTCFARNALRWYITLDHDVQNDWDRLQKALLDKYPAVDDIRSTPPTGVVQSFSPLGDGSQVELGRETAGEQTRLQTWMPNLNLVVGRDYMIRCRATNTLVDKAGWSTEPGDKIIGWSANGGTNQQWRLMNRPGTDYYYFVNVHSGLMMGYAGTLQAATPVTQQRNPVNFQIKTLGANLYTLSIPSTNYVLDVSGSNPSDGTEIILFPSHGGENQKFYLDCV